MSKSSRKGDMRENEWAKKVGGYKVSRKGYEGIDVISPPIIVARTFSKWEVKSAEALPNWLVSEDPDTEGWIGQMIREGADAVVFRQNYKPWYMLTAVDGTLELPE